MNGVMFFLVAVLIYLPTLVLVPQPIVYGVISIVGIFWEIRRVRKDWTIKKEEFFYLAFLLVSFIIYYLGKSYAIVGKSKSINDFIPYSLFIVTTIAFSKYLNPVVLRYLLYFIVLESIIGIIQYTLGIPYFIEPLSTGVQEFGTSDYLYYNKVFGLSAVVSIFAMKIFVGIMLNMYVKNNLALRITFFVVFLLGLLATFNRTSIVASIIFIILTVLSYYRSATFKTKVATIIIGLIVLIIIIANVNVILLQFLRGAEVDLSGRDLVFPYYLNFILEYPLLGNFFHKHWAELEIDRVYHAHNSYLQTFANMGILFGALLLTYFFKKINRRNYIYVIPILAYSSFQYGILWGVSFLDIIFFYFLFHRDLSD